MENEETSQKPLDCRKKLEKQHSIASEQKPLLTSAEIFLQSGKVQSEGKEDSKYPTESERPEDVHEVLLSENLLVIGVKEDEQKSIATANVNENSAKNPKLEGNQMETDTTKIPQNDTNTKSADIQDDRICILSQTILASASSIAASANSSPSVRYSEVIERTPDVVNLEVNNEEGQPKDCDQKVQQQLLQYEQELQQLKAALQQKDNMISLFQRENIILEKEKEAFRKEKDFATKEKESTVIKFAMKEKLVIDAKKEKEAVEKQLAEARKEIKTYSTKLQSINEEKSRVTYLMDEKCNEVRKYQRECEKFKTDCGHLESKLKYYMNKLNMETEAKQALEKKLEEERNAPNKLEEKANEKLKIEFEAQTILLKHEIANKSDQLDKLFKETEVQKDLIKHLQEQLNKETQEKSQISTSLSVLQEEHNHIQNSYSEEMLASAKLRGQLEDLQVLKTKNALNEDKIFCLSQDLKDALHKLKDNEQDLELLHAKEKELLSFNKEMSESIADLQNQICLLKSKAQGTSAENDLLKRERLDFDEKYNILENQLKQEQNQKNEERLLLAKHLSEKTKLYENTKIKLDNVLGDFEATKHKNVTVVKELQREIGKLKRTVEQNAGNHGSFSCSRCQNAMPNNDDHQQKENGYKESTTMHTLTIKRTHSRQSSVSTTEDQSVASSRRGSGSSESDTVTTRDVDFKDEKGPSKKHLVERILRLQQASARQTEKIDFLEQHSLSLVAELQKKAKVVQYYMLRDQAGALTSMKSDQNKSELAKYGNGVMSAIYGGIKGVENKSMSLELSLEINKKLQAVLEDTLLKNITLKENLDVLGLEVDNLTRKLRQLENGHGN